MVDDEFGDKKLPYIYWGLQSSKNGESPKKNRIKWNDRGILNIAHLLDGMSGHPEIYRTIFIGLG